jgi:hypothetical protein
LEISAMSSKREDALAALASVISAVMVSPAVPSPPVVVRDEPIAQKLPAGGRVIVWDGDATAEAILSPLRYAVELTADVEIVVPGATAAIRSARLDLLMAKVSDAVANNRTLGGVVEFSTIGVAALDIDAVDGAAPVHSATVPVTMNYTTDAHPQA